MWSASQRGRQAVQTRLARASRARGLSRRQRISSLRTLKPHSRQMPRSRFHTCSLTYDGSLRTFHSWTHASPQNVRRGGRTSPWHQRQTGRPSEARSGLPQFTALTAFLRLRDMIEKYRKLSAARIEKGTGVVSGRPGNGDGSRFSKLNWFGRLSTKSGFVA